MEQSFSPGVVDPRKLSRSDSTPMSVAFSSKSFQVDSNIQTTTWTCDPCQRIESVKTDLDISTGSPLKVVYSFIGSSCRGKGQYDDDTYSRKVQNGSDDLFQEQSSVFESIFERLNKLQQSSNKSTVSLSTGTTESSYFRLSTAEAFDSSHPVLYSLPTARFSNLNNKTISDLNKCNPPSTIQSNSTFLSSLCETGNQSNREIDGAKPRKSALPKSLKVRTSSKIGHKSVTWSTTITRIVDDETFEKYRTFFLSLTTPEGSSKSSAVAAVAYMCDIDKDISKSLIDMAWKLFWIKHSRYPTASELYTIMYDSNFEEKCLILEFIKECETEKRFPTVLRDITDPCVSEAVTQPSSQNCVIQTDVYPSSEKCVIQTDIQPSSEKCVIQTDIQPSSEKCMIQTDIHPKVHNYLKQADTISQKRTSKTSGSHTRDSVQNNMSTVTSTQLSLSPS